MTDSLRNRFSVFTRSRTFTLAMAAIGFLFIAGMIFEAGVYVGLHKGGFSARAGDNFERNFGARSFTAPSMGMQNPHGATGKIVSVELPNITLESDRMPEQLVRVASDTIIRNGMDTVAASTLAPGQYVVVLGAPSSDGDVDAKLIRIVPAPATTTPR